MLDVAKCVNAGLFTCAFLMSQSAHAVFLDFRDNLFSEAAGQNTFTAELEGIQLTIKARPADATLWWDEIDGFGIQYGYEQDEIEGEENLIITFHEPVNLQGIFITDLFNENGYLERGVFATNGEWHKFYASPDQLLGSTNGELWINIQFNDVEHMFFEAPGYRDGGENHEFSLGGLQVSAVPLPAALWLFGTGLLTLVGLMKKRR